MERTTFSVLFYLRRTKLTRNGEAPILMRLTINGCRIDAYVKKTVLPEQWSTSKGKALEKNDYCRQLNLYLDSVKMRLMKIQREMEIDGEHISAKTVLDRYQGRDQPERHTLMEVFREHNEKCRALSGIDMAPATVQRYETCLKHTLEFLQYKYRRDDIFLDEMNRQFVEDYEFFLKTRKNCCHNTATKYLKNFKKITRIAIQKEWLKKDPFADIRFSLHPVERDFLEKHELDAIAGKKITIPRLGQVRDIFVFCCYTGLAFSDIQQLRPEHIATGADGAIWIRKARQKTRNMCNIPLLDVAIAIMKKYKSHPYCQTHGVVLPVLCNQKMNAYLKELSDLCGIKKQLTTHTARHTFATLTLSNGVSMENVAKMLGHSNTNMTRHYAKVLDSSIMRDMQKMQENMKTG